MKKRTLFALLLTVSIGFSFREISVNENDQPETSVKTTETAIFKEGDLIFQTSSSSQNQAIQVATKSKYSHCGILFMEAGRWFVYEAVQPVKKTPLDVWISRGKEGKYSTKRLKNADKVLTQEIITDMKKTYNGFAGRNYDLTFEWSDERIYCSELIWKIYQRTTGIEIGKLQKLGEFDLTNPLVKQKLKERYGENIPMDETVISPGSIFDSELLITAKSN